MLGLKWRMLVVGLACATMAAPAAAQSISTDFGNGRSTIIIQGGNDRYEDDYGRRPPPGYRHYERRSDWDERGPPRGYHRRGPAIMVEPAPRPRMRAANAHVRWCMDRYRSYNASSDSYRGNDGRLRRCNSPYI